MSRKIQMVAGLTLAAGLMLAGTTSAFAGTPSPNPTPSQQSTCTPAPHSSDSSSPYGSPTINPNFGYNPCPTPEPRQLCPVVLGPIPQPLTPRTDLRNCRVHQQEFDIADVAFQVAPGQLRERDQVLGSGPIGFDLGRDVTLTPTTDRLSDRFGDSVVIHHAALDGVTVDRATCSLNIDQNDVPWWIRGGGTGIDRNAIGAGLYDLRGVVSFPTRNFNCTLPVGLTATQAAFDLNNNTGLPLPLMFDIGVQATGWSANLHRDRNNQDTLSSYVH
jgi:hypothetical protein